MGGCEQRGGKESMNARGKLSAREREYECTRETQCAGTLVHDSPLDLDAVAVAKARELAHVRVGHAGPVVSKVHDRRRGRRLLSVWQ